MSYWGGSSGGNRSMKGYSSQQQGFHQQQQPMLERNGAPLPIGGDWIAGAMKGAAPMNSSGAGESTLQNQQQQILLQQLGTDAVDMGQSLTQIPRQLPPNPEHMPPANPHQMPASLGQPLGQGPPHISNGMTPIGLLNIPPPLPNTPPGQNLQGQNLPGQMPQVPPLPGQVPSLPPTISAEQRSEYTIDPFGNVVVYNLPAERSGLANAVAVGLFHASAALSVGDAGLPPLTQLPVTLPTPQQQQQNFSQNGLGGLPNQIPNVGTVSAPRGELNSNAPEFTPIGLFMDNGAGTQNIGGQGGNQMGTNIVQHNPIDNQSPSVMAIDAALNQFNQMSHPSFARTNYEAGGGNNGANHQAGANAFGSPNGHMPHMPGSEHWQGASNTRQGHTLKITKNPFDVSQHATGAFKHNADEKTGHSYRDSYNVGWRNEDSYKKRDSYVSSKRDGGSDRQARAKGFNGDSKGYVIEGEKGKSGERSEKGMRKGGKDSHHREGQVEFPIGKASYGEAGKYNSSVDKYGGSEKPEKFFSTTSMDMRLRFATLPAAKDLATDVSQAVKVCMELFEKYGDVFPLTRIGGKFRELGVLHEGKLSEWVQNNLPGCVVEQDVADMNRKQAIVRKVVQCDQFSKTRECGRGTAFTVSVGDQSLPSPGKAVVDGSRGCHANEKLAMQESDNIKGVEKRQGQIENNDGVENPISIAAMIGGTKRKTLQSKSRNKTKYTPELGVACLQLARKYQAAKYQSVTGVVRHSTNRFTTFIFIAVDSVEIKRSLYKDFGSCEVIMHKLTKLKHAKDQRVSFNLTAVITDPLKHIIRPKAIAVTPVGEIKAITGGAAGELKLESSPVKKQDINAPSHIQGNLDEGTIDRYGPMGVEAFDIPEVNKLDHSTLTNIGHSTSTVIQPSQPATPASGCSSSASSSASSASSGVGEEGKCAVRMNVNMNYLNLPGELRSSGELNAFQTLQIPPSTTVPILEVATAKLDAVAVPAQISAVESAVGQCIADIALEQCDDVATKFFPDERTSDALDAMY